MSKLFYSLGLTLAILFVSASAQAARLKDLADIEGVRSNQLIGYGIVVGLQGSGDKKGTEFTSQAVANLLERLGTRVSTEALQVANVAGVVVTAELPPFARPGLKLDVSLSSLGDAKTLQGGTLLMTPLRGPNGKVYAVAQGPVSIGGFVIAGGGGVSVQQNHPTVGRIAGGGTVERALDYDLFAEGQIRVVLREPDFNTIIRVENAIEKVLGKGKARAIDSASVVVPLDNKLGRDPIMLLAKLEHLQIEPDVAARVVINERTGTIIVGDEVRVSKVALAHGNLNIKISAERAVSQPNPLAEGETATVENNEVAVGEEVRPLNILDNSVSLNEVVQGLNALGATPRDLIAIFQSLKRAGALQADLLVM